MHQGGGAKIEAESVAATATLADTPAALDDHAHGAPRYGPRRYGPASS
jgi:hypothetical protein